MAIVRFNFAHLIGFDMTEANRLAQAWEKCTSVTGAQETAAELRRLQAENEALRKEIADIPLRSFCAPAYATLDTANIGRNDPMYADALELIEKHQKCSVSLIQRHLRISYNRASFMVDHAKEDAARAKEQTP
jgi:DNA segregation ATPase FtsK/SpoIIIE-like protein